MKHNNNLPVAFQIMAHIAALGFTFSRRGEKLILTRPGDSELPDETRELTKQHKQAILDQLKPVRNAYSYTFTDNRGAGTYLTKLSKQQARQQLENQFPQYDLTSFNVINETAH